MADRTKSGSRRPALSFVTTDRTPESATNMMRDAIDFLLLRQPALDDESGQDLIEYALLVALVVLVAIGAVTAVGTTINTVFWSYISGVMSAI
jgi:Flp pilus assembly pilin Flp